MQIQEFFPIDDRIMAAAEAAEKRCREDFAKIEDNAAYNGAKVLAAFQKSRVSEPCFYGTTATATRAGKCWIKLWLQHSTQRMRWCGTISFPERTH